ARSCPLRHRVGLAAGRLPRLRILRLQPLPRARERRLTVARGPVLVDLRQHDGKLIFRPQLHRAVAELDGGKGLAPVALARKEPVAQAIADRALAQAALLQPRDDFLLRVRHVEPVEERAVHVRAVAEVSLALDITACHDLHDGQAELLRERPVTLVVGGAREYGTGAVAREYIIGNPDRNVRAVDGIDRKRAGRDARLGRVGRFRGALALAPRGDTVAVRGDR